MTYRSSFPGPEAGARSAAQGHVFVVHARLEGVGADATIIPTDAGFDVRPIWEPLVGEDAARHRPSNWSRRRIGRSPHARSLWFIDVARPAEAMFGALTELLDEFAATVTDTSGGRFLPRVALPMLGTFHGGHGDTRGRIIDLLLQAAHTAVRRSRIDIALVALDRADFAALQTARRAAFGAKPNVHARRLADRARHGDLALFLGAGVSVPAGLPSWKGLLDAIADEQQVNLAGLPDVLDQAEFLRKRLRSKLGAAVKRQLSHAARPSLAHAQLASLGCMEAVTTNFDTLYERAVASSGRGMAVLPWEQPAGRQPWLLKLHGDVEHPGDVVLARRDFARFNADRGPAGAMLQSLMMSRHLLVVGASMTDANVLRLAHEVMHFRRAHGLKAPVGTVLTLEPEPGQRRLWAGELDWINVGRRAKTEQEAGRNLEIFLDELAMWAVTDAGYLLDPRYAALLNAAEKSLVQDARGLLPRLDEMGGTHREAWQAVREFLRSHGARLQD